MEQNPDSGAGDPQVGVSWRAPGPIGSLQGGVWARGGEPWMGKDRPGVGLASALPHLMQMTLVPYSPDRTPGKENY